MRKHLDVNDVGDVTTVRFRDLRLLDGQTIEAVRDELFALVDNLGRRNLLLNFSGLMFFSSAVLGTFITLNKKLVTAGGQLVICNLDPQLYEVFEITKLNKLFRIARDEDEGLAGVACRVKPPKPSDQNAASLRIPRSEED